MPTWIRVLQRIWKICCQAFPSNENPKIVGNRAVESWFWARHASTKVSDFERGNFLTPSFKLQHYPKNKRLSVVRCSATTTRLDDETSKKFEDRIPAAKSTSKISIHICLLVLIFRDPRNFFLTPLLILHPTKELIDTTLNTNPPKPFQVYISIMFRTRVSEVYIVSNEQLHIFWREMVVEYGWFSSTDQVFRLQHAFVAAWPISCRISSFRIFAFS